MECLLSTGWCDCVQIALNTFAQCNPKQSQILLGSFFSTLVFGGETTSVHLLAVTEPVPSVLGSLIDSSQCFLLKVDRRDRLRLGDVWIVAWCQGQVSRC